MTLTAALLLMFILAVPTAKSATSAAKLRAQIRDHVRDIEQAKTTLRFFRTHWILLYKWRTKRVAHRDRARARARVHVGRVHLRRLRVELRHALIPHEAQWNCIHQYEGSWTDPNAPYYGGLQMDLEFQQTYGLDLLRAKGTADHWTPDEQMIVAERAYVTRGFWPWPNTARWCGLI